MTKKHSTQNTSDAGTISAYTKAWKLRNTFSQYLLDHFILDSNTTAVRQIPDRLTDIAA